MPEELTLQELISATQRRAHPQAERRVGTVRSSLDNTLIMLRHVAKNLGSRLSPARAAAVNFFHTSPLVESSLPKKNGTLATSPAPPPAMRHRFLLTYANVLNSLTQGRRKSVKARRLCLRRLCPRISREVSEHSPSHRSSFKFFLPSKRGAPLAE